jgi:membrane protein
MFSPAAGTETTLGVIGGVFLLIAVLSFSSRAVQRLFEQAWELRPLSVRNTLNRLVWMQVFSVSCLRT